MGDEVVTLRNDRRLVTSSGDWVRNGEAWVVQDRQGSSLTLCSVRDGGTVTLPPGYATQHVALSYALTVHKSQGMTVDASVVVVSPEMTAAQLYVGMTRGRLDNRAVAITDGSEWDHAAFMAPSPEEVLARVLRHDGPELSAHEVIRGAYVDAPSRSAMAEMLREAQAHIERQAGPDHSTEIARLRQVGDVARAARLAAQAEARLTAAEARVAQAQADLEALRATPSLRAALPGRLGSGARERHHAGLVGAQEDLAGARRSQSVAAGATDRSRHDLFVAREASRALTELEPAQEAREDWLARHPAERDWVAQLEHHLYQRHLEAPHLANQAIIDRPYARSLLERQEELGRPLRAEELAHEREVVGALLRAQQLRQQAELYHHLQPQRGPEIEGPSLGL
ncbi:MAG: hypothetical protein ACYCTI_05990 [Acidimicrobiales bacterium]